MLCRIMVLYYVKGNCIDVCSLVRAFDTQEQIWIIKQTTLTYLSEFLYLLTILFELRDSNHNLRNKFMESLSAQPPDPNLCSRIPNLNIFQREKNICLSFLVFCAGVDDKNLYTVPPKIKLCVNVGDWKLWLCVQPQKCNACSLLNWKS